MWPLSEAGTAREPCGVSGVSIAAYYSPGDIPDIPPDFPKAYQWHALAMCQGYPWELSNRPASHQFTPDAALEPWSQRGRPS